MGVPGGGRVPFGKGYRLLRIEEELGSKGEYAGLTAYKTLGENSSQDAQLEGIATEKILESSLGLWPV